MCDCHRDSVCGCHRDSVCMAVTVTVCVWLSQGQCACLSQGQCVCVCRCVCGCVWVGVCVCVCVAVTCTVCATVTGTVCVTVTGTVCVVCAAVNLDFKLLKFLSVTERLSTKNLTSYISEPVLSYIPLVTHDACHSLEHLQYSCQCFLSYPDATTTAVDPLSRPFSC